MMVPVFRAIYAPVKQLILAFSPDNEAGFKRVVLVDEPGRGLVLGFLTREFTVDRGAGREAMVAVYVPTNHLYLGDVLVFPAERVSLPGSHGRAGHSHLSDRRAWPYPGDVRTTDRPNPRRSALWYSSAFLSGAAGPPLFERRIGLRGALGGRGDMSGLISDKTSCVRTARLGVAAARRAVAGGHRRHVRCGVAPRARSPSRRGGRARRRIARAARPTSYCPICRRCSFIGGLDGHTLLTTGLAGLRCSASSSAWSSSCSSRRCPCIGRCARSPS